MKTLTADAVEKIQLIERRCRANKQRGRSTPATITGLINRPELNGRVAMIIGNHYGDRTRIIVSLCPENKEIALKLKNLELIQTEGDSL
jgi:hypothetical protein